MMKLSKYQNTHHSECDLIIPDADKMEYRVSMEFKDQCLNQFQKNLRIIQR